MPELPWSPRTRQQTGMQTEAQIAKQRGARLHPRSGAGKVKDDASNDHEIIEVKDAKKSHTLHGKALNALLRRAIQQGKEARYIIYFTDNNLTAEITLRRGKG